MASCVMGRTVSSPSRARIPGKLNVDQANLISDFLFYFMEIWRLHEPIKRPEVDLKARGQVTLSPSPPFQGKHSELTELSVLCVPLRSGTSGLPFCPVLPRRGTPFPVYPPCIHPLLLVAQRPLLLYPVLHSSNPYFT